MFKLKTCLEINFADLEPLAIQTAATVHEICAKRPTKPLTLNNMDEADPIAHQLQSFNDWSHWDYINMLESQVRLLFSYVETALQLQAYPSRKHLIITEALSAYQEWKTAFITANPRNTEATAHWLTSGEDFIKKDWTVLNEQFIGRIDVPYRP